MIRESFAEGTGLLHQLDPRVKITIACFLAVVVATSPKPGVLLPAASFVIILLAGSDLPFLEVAKRMALVNTFVILLALTLPFSTAGEIIYRIGAVKISREGLILAGLILAKVNIILLAMILLLSTSSVFTLAHALHHLHLPSRFVQLLFFTFRYLHVLEEELKKMLEAAKLRCFRPRTNLLTYRTYAYLLASLFIRSYDRSERIYQAMVCRGFRGTFPVYHHFHLNRRDVFFLGLSGAYWLALAIWAFG
ncbi:cobalt ECF transporter T component CbiQ [Thermosulfuriphilus sp.]